MPNLVGIGLSQVPTNGMLGGLAYQDPEHASIKDLDLKNLSQINSEISDTAVDVFVYDTRKDSDGGAWRKRTQHTSWYNETLGTATRGTRKEFPSVAVLVLEGTKLTIYDGDDPDLPMWMVFNKASNSYFSVTTNSCVTALNGKIVSGGNASNDRLRVIDFLLDNELEYSHTAGRRTHLRPISDRNGTAGFTAYDSSLPGIVDRYVNDVAMTVLPNAPIDDATGLPVPTIAVATDSGISVIRDDGIVVDIKGNHGGNYNQSTFVDFDSKTNAIISGFDYGTGNTNQIYKLVVFPIPSKDVTDNNNNYTGYQHHYRRIQTGGNPTIPKLAGNRIKDAISAGGDGRYAIQTNASGGYPTALNIIQEEPGTDGSNTTYPSNSRIAYATTSYNTGWMHGDIKGAFLSDTDTTNVTGEKIDLTNGSVPAGNNASVASVTANQLVFQSSSEVVGRYDTGTTLVTGKQYHATLTISNYSGSGNLGVASGGGIDSTFRYSANGTYTRYITGDDANQIQLFYRSSNSATVGLTIKEVDRDRSLNNNGLAVYGTITKSAVATGADLVGYSGFSNSTNYLSQPPNSDLAIGNSDFSSVGWFKKTTSSNTGVIIYANDGSNQTFDVRVHTNMKMLAQITDDGFSTREIVSNQGSTVNDNIWHQYHAVRRSNIMYLYLDGELLGSSSSVEANITNSLGVTIGAENLSGNAKEFQGSLALIRFSKSAPSPEQIKKMYEDEKHLFQENAKATLYGSSDNVTAIAYDDSTDSLHVGTSAGRSEFQGLRRINNTTTAVTTAISASNGLVAEQ